MISTASDRVNGLHFHYNGDRSGDLHISFDPEVTKVETNSFAGRAWAEIQIPYADILDLVMGGVRNELISKLEQMDGAELVEFLTKS